MMRAGPIMTGEATAYACANAAWGQRAASVKAAQAEVMQTVTREITY